MDGELPTTPTPQAPPTIAVASTRLPRRRGRAIVRALMWSLPFAAAAGALFIWLTGGRYIETDNAYVKGDRVYLATEISGPIVEVLVRENQHVSRGELLYKIDDSPYRIQLAKIESEMDSARADIRGLKAQWRTKREEIQSARSQLTYATADYERQRDLAERKIAPAAKLEESRMSLDIATRRISAGEEDLTRIEAALAGDPNAGGGLEGALSMARRPDAAGNAQETAIREYFQMLMVKDLEVAIAEAASFGVRLPMIELIKANALSTSGLEHPLGQPLAE